MPEKVQEHGLFEAPSSRPKTRLEPHFLEPQVLSTTAQLVFKPESARLDHLGKFSGKYAIRKVMPLIPTAFPWAKAVSRQIKTSVENTIYVYPIQFDRFPSRYCHSYWCYCISTYSFARYLCVAIVTFAQKLN
jgi:hypothetical protein